MYVIIWIWILVTQMKGLAFLEEKVYELITKLYSEMQNGFSNIRGDITNMQGDITGMRSDIAILQGDSTSTRGDIANIQGDIANMRGDITSMRSDISDLKKGQVKFENELKETRTTLFDGYKLVFEKLESLDHKVDKLAVIVESHDVKIEVIRGAK